ncbi:MAG: Cupin 2 conserved barrel domain protein [Chitinophagaceae bacterium]|nr:Cupin 2 conserved barrel domain protein [Chitinophagaceae bacterium]
MNLKHDDTELKKSALHLIIQIVDYVPNAILTKTILKKITGNITALAFSAGEEIDDKISPFDIYVQVIDGVCQLCIAGAEYRLKLGEGIIIPAHATHNFAAREQFKMLNTVIKSGYENF